MSLDNTLSLSTVTATIHAPIEKVDIADWVLHLPDAEYQRCSTAHIAAGATTTDDGRPMSINVETIGDAFVVQHYVAEVREPHFCRMVSISDSISPAGRTKLRVVWELSVKKSTTKRASTQTTFTQLQLIRPWLSSRNTISLSREHTQLASRHRMRTIRRRLRNSQRVSNKKH